MVYNYLSIYYEFTLYNLKISFNRFCSSIFAKVKTGCILF